MDARSEIKNKNSKKSNILSTQDKDERRITNSFKKVKLRNDSEPRRTSTSSWYLNTDTQTDRDEKTREQVNSPTVSVPAPETMSENSGASLREVSKVDSSSIVVAPSVAIDKEVKLQSQNLSNKFSNTVQQNILSQHLPEYNKISKNRYFVKRMYNKEIEIKCDCFLNEEEAKSEKLACGKNCINRLLMIECSRDCLARNFCTNKRFKKMQYASCEVFDTGKKGFGIRAAEIITSGEFILEFVGEVVGPAEYEKRAAEYIKNKNRHQYFMKLRRDAIIDATQKGNISRFVNHSCDPNAEIQKWIVNREFRIGFFSKRTISVGEEITVDYKCKTWGKEPQRCYCEAKNCKGWIGENLNITYNIEIQEYDKDRQADSAAANMNKSNPLKLSKVNEKSSIRIFEQLELQEEINVLLATGVQNQTHTLKLSRLMLQVTDINNRMHLLKLLRQGSQPCKRLFLDYKGLKLIHAWMCDVPNMPDSEIQKLVFKKETLLTLASLPISNITMLRDSKILQTVEVWSTKTNIAPDSEMLNKGVFELSKHMNRMCTDSTKDQYKSLMKGFDNTDANENYIHLQASREYERVSELGTKLLNEWSVLKESFRIPKKDRVEEMKTHEREANNDEIKNKHVISKAEDYQNTSKTNSHIVAGSNQMWRHDPRRLLDVQRTKAEASRSRTQKEVRRRCMINVRDPRISNSKAYLPQQYQDMLPMWTTRSNSFTNMPFPVAQPQFAAVIEPANTLFQKPPAPRFPNLPPNWNYSYDQYGRLYYYNVEKKISQWESPTFPISETPYKVYGEYCSTRYKDFDEYSPSSESSSDSLDSSSTSSSNCSDSSTNEGNYLYDKVIENSFPNSNPSTPGSRSTKDFKVSNMHQTKTNHFSKFLESKTAICHNSKKSKEIMDAFHFSLARAVVRCLNMYRKPDCKVGRITNSKDFMYIATKITNLILEKELRHAKNKRLAFNNSVSRKTKACITKYMSNFRGGYVRRKNI